LRLKRTGALRTPGSQKSCSGLEPFALVRRPNRQLPRNDRWGVVMSTSNQTVSEHRQLMHELLGPVTMSLLGLAVALLVTAHFPTIVFG
jgi:hypothetical protein